jgi:hypothetical protein
MWCFFDESYPDEGGVTSIICCLMKNETVAYLDRRIYLAKKKYWGEAQAKSLRTEIKGNKLFSNNSFKMAKKHGTSKNLLVAQEILADCFLNKDDHPIKVFGCAVYGAQDLLKKINKENKLTIPIAEILKRVSVAAHEMDGNRRVNLVFDEQLSDLELAISTRRFVSGVGIENISHYPLIAVSHVSPGLQLADLGAYILGRRAAGDHRFHLWLSRLKQLEWKGKVNGLDRWGIQRWDISPTGVTVRKKWE